MEKEKLTFEDLPVLVLHLQKKIENIEDLLIHQKNQYQESDVLMTVEETANFLRLSKATIYCHISRGDIPHLKRSKRVYFSKVELMNWLNSK